MSFLQEGNTVFFGVAGEGSGMLWRFQMTLGVMVLLAGILIAVFPQILVAIVAATTMLVGASLMVSGWRLRQFSHRPGAGTAYHEVIDSY